MGCGSGMLESGSFGQEAIGRQAAGGAAAETLGSKGVVEIMVDAGNFFACTESIPGICEGRNGEKRVLYVE